MIIKDYSVLPVCVLQYKGLMYKNISPDSDNVVRFIPLVKLPEDDDLAKVFVRELQSGRRVALPGLLSYKRGEL